MTDEDTPADDWGTWENPELRWRTYATIVFAFGWIGFVIAWWTFLGGDRTHYENMAVTIASAIILGGVISAFWLPWSFKHDPRVREAWGVHGFVVRVVWSLAIFLGLASIFVWWLWWQAEQYTTYQNLAIFILFVVSIWGMIAPVWVRWRVRIGDEERKAIEDEVSRKVTEEVERALKDAGMTFDGGPGEPGEPEEAAEAEVGEDG
jgi:MFS family permease